jgi:uncharacterized protein YkwD
MRFLPWIGSVILVATLGGGAVATLRPHNTTAYSQIAARTPVVVASSPLPKLDSGAYQHLVPTPPPPPPPQAAAAGSRAAGGGGIVVRTTQQQLINQDRAAAGLGPLSWSDCLYSVAASNAGRLSRQGWTAPYHTNGPSQDLGCGLGHQAGENVGYWSAGVNDSKLNTMFMNSAEHHANIMGPYRYVATAWAVAPNGYAYVAVEFS